ncbi:sensor histidine kinase [Haloarcula nitratireducens]|uniref:histidine kinase n=1 Tax=Haloarcula nitratireducens TaxID=2487749 RepID=A0AAW4PF73_9EURY|nr:ATP-binding protein [Halomicroarcula nitratireducens]MBX0296702.1 response regulator [Halomicroarcula nitratireducens]
MADSPDIIVLYVNDNTELLELVSRQLTNESDRLSVVTAESADRGREILDSRTVDCILSDYHMPDRTGIDFLRGVREDYPDIPFLLFTETGNETVASESIEAGVTDYVIQEVIGNQAPLLVNKIVTYVEHRRSQQAIKETNEQLREIVSVADQAFWVFSPDWSELRFINDGHEAIFGQSIEKVRAEPQSFLDQVHPGDIDRVTLAMERASAGQPQLVQYRANKSDTVEIWVESRCKPITDQSGNVVSLIGITRDITDRKMNQQELVEKIDQLEEFTSTVAHDLRNPLNVADGNIRMAAMEYESGQLETALEAVSRMDTLIEELLTLAKDGELIGNRDHIEFAEVVTTSYENVRAPGSSLEVTGSMLLDCDSARLSQAFENIIRNAVEHGSSDVSLTAGVLSRGRGVYIEDDGPGISVAKRDRIFDKGYTTHEDGSGFGLAIVDRIISGHGWEINAMESETGGARFEVRVAD